MGSIAIAGGGGRSLQRADTTFHVAAGGSDATGTGSAAKPWATFSFAYGFLTEFIDFGGRNITLLGDGSTFTTGLAMNSDWTGGGSLTLDMAGGGFNTVGDCIGLNNVALSGTFTFQNLTLASSAGLGMNINGPSILMNGPGVNFGACSQFHFAISEAATAIFSNDYTISGNGGQAHLLAYGNGSQIYFTPTNGVTLTGVPAFTYFADAQNEGYIEYDQGTFTGAATGQRFRASGDGFIFMFGGGGPLTFPGNQPGIIATGGGTSFWPADGFSTTVGNLPPNTSVPVGYSAFVTDSTVTLAAGLGNIVAGGAGNATPVYNDGTNWRIG